MPRASSLREVNIDLLFISKITMYMYPSCLVSSCLHFQLCSHHALSASMFVSFFICVLYFISHKSPALYLLSVHYLCSLFPSLPYLFFFFLCLQSLSSSSLQFTICSCLHRLSVYRIYLLVLLISVFTLTPLLQYSSPSTSFPPFLFVLIHHL